MTQHPLANPYAHVHPFFWPVLWLSLRAFVAWSGKMIEAGHGFAGLAVELTWYGTIRVRTLDLSAERAAFHRHMMGERCEDGWSVLTAAAGRIDKLLKLQNPLHSREGFEGGPRSGQIDPVDRFEPEKAPAGAGPQSNTIQSGSSPPLVHAPLPHAERGRAVSKCQHPPLRTAPPLRTQALAGACCRAL